MGELMLMLTTLLIRLNIRIQWYNMTICGGDFSYISHIAITLLRYAHIHYIIYSLLCSFNDADALGVGATPAIVSASLLPDGHIRVYRILGTYLIDNKIIGVAIRGV